VEQVYRHGQIKRRRAQYSVSEVLPSPPRIYPQLCWLWAHNLRDVNLVLLLSHLNGRVLCALANGTVVVFRRGPDGQWDLKQYYVVELSSPAVSIRCMVAVHSRVWCGYRNQIHVLDPKTLQVQVSREHDPKEKYFSLRSCCLLGNSGLALIRSVL